MAKATPGPWVKSDDSGICEGMGAWLVMSPDNLRSEGAFIIAGVVDIDRQCWPDAGDAEANARLIAAAPCLLAACQAARIELAFLIEQVKARPNGSVDAAHKACIAAIAKATNQEAPCSAT